MSEHTKGRMTVTDTGSDYFFSVIRLGRKDIDVKDHHIARRLAAAWNACEGIDTGSLERIGDNFIKPMIDLQDQRDAAKAELNAARALLREVLEAVDSRAKEYLDRGLEVAEVLEIARVRSYLDACDTLEGK